MGGGAGGATVVVPVYAGPAAAPTPVVWPHGGPQAWLGANVDDLHAVHHAAAGAGGAAMPPDNNEVLAAGCAAGAGSGGGVALQHHEQSAPAWSQGQGAA